MTSTPHRPWVELEFFLERDGITKAELGRAAGLSPNYIGDLVKGRRQAHGRVRKIIADALRVPQFMLMPPPPEEEEPRWTKWREWFHDEDDEEEVA